MLGFFKKKEDDFQSKVEQVTTEFYLPNFEEERVDDLEILIEKLKERLKKIALEILDFDTLINCVLKYLEEKQGEENKIDIKDLYEKVKKLSELEKLLEKKEKKKS